MLGGILSGFHFSQRGWIWYLLLSGFHRIDLKIWFSAYALNPTYMLLWSLLMTLLSCLHISYQNMAQSSSKLHVQGHFNVKNQLDAVKNSKLGEQLLFWNILFAIILEACDLLKLSSIFDGSLPKFSKRYEDSLMTIFYLRQKLT